MGKIQLQIKLDLILNQSLMYRKPLFPHFTEQICLILISSNIRTSPTVQYKDILKKLCLETTDMRFTNKHFYKAANQGTQICSFFVSFMQSLKFYFGHQLQLHGYN